MDILHCFVRGSENEEDVFYVFNYDPISESCDVVRLVSEKEPNRQYLELGDKESSIKDGFIEISALETIGKNINLIPIGTGSTSLSAIISRAFVLKYSRSYYNNYHLPIQKESLENRKKKVNYAGRIFDHQEIENLIDSSLEFWLTSGRYAKEFERNFSKFLGIRHTLLVNSGSSANLVAFNSITSVSLKDKQFKKGDEIITVAAGFPTTIVPAIQYGAVPVFLDIEIPTYNIDVTRLEEALSPKTKAVMIAHSLGNPFDLKSVTDFCKKHNLWLIEDNCDALGAKYYLDGIVKNTGTFGDLGTSSFYPPHHMTMGEGGAVYTNNNQLKKIAESFRDWGRDCWCPSGQDNTCGKRFDWELGSLPQGYDHKYIYSHFGFNLKVTDMQAAIGLAQLGKIESFIEKRNQNWNFLKENLSDLSEFIILPEATKNSEPSWFGFLITIRDGVKYPRREVVQKLESDGIQTRMLFAGNFLRHPAMNELRASKDQVRIIGDLTNSDKIMNDSFWLGVYPGLNESHLGYVSEKLKNIFKK